MLEAEQKNPSEISSAVSSLSIVFVPGRWGHSLGTRHWWSRLEEESSAGPTTSAVSWSSTSGTSVPRRALRVSCLGHFWEWWDGNIFVKLFQFFLVVLDHQAITIKSFSATSPLLSMVYRWFLCLSNIGFYRLGHGHRPSHRRTNASVSMDRSHLYLCVKEAYNFNSHEKIVISGLKRALTSLCGP